MFMMIDISVSPYDELPGIVLAILDFMTRWFLCLLKFNSELLVSLIVINAHIVVYFLTE